MNPSLICTTNSPQVVLGCLSVVSAAPFYGLVAHPNGAVVPVDEPRVAAARAEHLAAKGAIAYAAPVGYAGFAHAAAAVPALTHAAAAAPVAYSTGTPVRPETETGWRM